MARHLNSNWNLPDSDENGKCRDGIVTNALLMDIRDELQRLNRLFHCVNFVNIPKKLDQIRHNTTKRKRPVIKRVAAGN